MDQPGLPRGEITKLLSSWNEGEDQALNDLLPLVYDELRNSAKHFFKHKTGDQTLSPTVLINEVYLRLQNNRQFRFKNRTQFFWFAGQLMRHILVENARAKMAKKRGSGERILSLDQITDFADRNDIDSATLIAIDEALRRLMAMDPRQCRIVELRFFAGLNFQELASVFNLSLTTIKREWRLAKLWLAAELKKQNPDATAYQS